VRQRFWPLTSTQQPDRKDDAEGRRAEGAERMKPSALVVDHVQPHDVVAVCDIRRKPSWCGARHLLFTVGQPTRTVADMSEPAHAPDATLARIPKQRFGPDMEAVVASLKRH
jgi:hypothetical protein